MSPPAARWRGRVQCWSRNVFLCGSSSSRASSMLLNPIPSLRRVCSSFPSNRSTLVSTTTIGTTRWVISLDADRSRPFDVRTITQNFMSVSQEFLHTSFKESSLGIRNCKAHPENFPQCRSDHHGTALPNGVQFILHIHLFSSSVNEMFDFFQAVAFSSLKPDTVVENKKTIVRCDEFAVNVRFSSGVLRDVLAETFGNATVAGKK